MADHEAWTCASCGGEVASGKGFCTACGAAREVSPAADPAPDSCRACGSAVQPGDEHCRACGARIGEPPPSPSAAPSAAPAAATRPPVASAPGPAPSSPAAVPPARTGRRLLPFVVFGAGLLAAILAVAVWRAATSDPPPPRPEITEVAGGNRSVTVTVKAPDMTMGADVIVEASTDGATWRQLAVVSTNTVGVASAVASDIPNGTTVRVRASYRTATGHGPWSPLAAAQTGMTCTVDQFKTVVDGYIDEVNAVQDAENARLDDSISVTVYFKRTLAHLKSAKEKVQALNDNCFFVEGGPADAAAVRKALKAHYAGMVRYERELLRYLLDKGGTSERTERFSTRLEALVDAFNTAWDAFGAGTGDFQTTSTSGG